ncbi:MAG: hypothetical protein ABI589_07755 [Burkholderiales bacterium]
MSKSFSKAIVLAIAAVGTAGLAQAQGAAGPSYPALKSVHSEESRAQVESSAHDALTRTSRASQYAGFAQGASYPALQANFTSAHSRAEVASEARPAVGAALSINSDNRDGA